MDMVLRRTFPDTIVIARSNFDSHGYIIHPLFMIRPPDRDDIEVRGALALSVATRADGVIVTGLGVSASPRRAAVHSHATRRPEPGLRRRRRRRHDREKGRCHTGARYQGVTEAPRRRRQSAREHPPRDRQLPAAEGTGRRAVRRVVNDYDGLEIVLAQFDTAQPLLRQALAAAPETNRLIYAQILGMMGDGTGAEVLADAVNARQWTQAGATPAWGSLDPA